MRNIHKSPAAALKCLLSILALFTMNLPVVHAWGKDGHEIVANIAYNLLTPQTREAAYKILFPLNDYDFNATGHTSPLAAVANWADKVRFVKYFSWTTPLHYVDVRDTLIPNGCPCTPEKTDNATGTGSSSGEELRVSQGEGQQRECKFVYKRDCAGDLCAVGAIVNFSHLSKKPRKKFSMTTASTSTDKRLRALPVPPQNPYISHNITQRQSLMFLIHIIGDIHQPLHSSRESDRGGNTIPVSFVEEEFPGFRDERLGHAHSQWNLHSVWDAGIILRGMRLFYNSSQYNFQQHIEQTLLTRDNMELWTVCPLNHRDQHSTKACSSQWAEESFRDALMYAYGDEHGKEVQSNAVLTEEYFTSRLEVIKLRLAAGGVRLAATLEDIYGIPNNKHIQSA